MPFSQRTNWNTEESDLARAHRERLAAGLPIADLTASNPTRCGFRYPDSLLAALADPRALDYDPQPRGLHSARQAVCAYYRSHRVELSPEQIILTTSTSEAYSFLFRLLADPGDEILIPQPSYPLFDFLAALDDVRLRAAPLVYENGWQIDAEAIRRDLTPRTRAIVLVHPNNPTGHFTKPWEADALASLCREHGLPLIVDEVFLDYEYAGSEPPQRLGPIAGDPGEGTNEQGNRTMGSFARGLAGVPIYVVSGLSKITALPQMKAAWILATGPRHDQALARLEVIADTFLSMNAPVQGALPAWLEGRAEIQSQIRSRVAANLAVLDQAIGAVPSVQRLALEGGWYAVLRIPAIQPDEQTVLELLDRGVWLHPGYFFGMPESGWLVVSLLAAPSEFSNGVATLINYLGTNHGCNKKP